MKTLDFNLPASHSGGKLTGFNYTRSINELIGTWSATAVGGNFKIGSIINVGNVLTNGVITRVYKDSDGLIHLEGKDAGVWLMRTTPNTNDLAEGNAKEVIKNLCSGCGIGDPVMGTNGLDGFNVRSVVSGSTRAEAILELALLSSCVAYINNVGRLVVAPVPNNTPTFNNIIQENGMELDLDGYATSVTVVVTRRKENPLDDPNRKWHKSKEPKYKYVWEGTELVDLRFSRENASDTFSFTDGTGELVSGSFAAVIITPANVLESMTQTITRAGITTTITEEHEYDLQTAIWKSQGRQRGVYAWCETGYEITTTITGTYPLRDGTTTTVSETTHEVMTREFDHVVGVNSALAKDYSHVIGLHIENLVKETITKTTTREGKAPETDMPAYAPPYDSKVTRQYDTIDFGRMAVCIETTSSYEAQQVGTIDTVSLDNAYVKTDNNVYLAIPTHATPQWVEKIATRAVYERYDLNGNCVWSYAASCTDDGAAWLLKNALTPTSSEELNQYQIDYAKNSQNAPQLSVSLNGGGGIANPWQFIELEGQHLVAYLDEGEEGEPDALNRDTWYENGAYKSSLTECPHLDVDTNKCKLHGNLSIVGDFSGDDCPNASSWKSCIRVQAALEQARYEDPDIGGDAPMLEAPVTATATRNGTLVGYKREFYIDDIITESEARSIAQAAANNILTVKTNKGFTRSITIPYNSNLVPDGVIISVVHDWANMQTTVTYRDNSYGDIPTILIPNSIAGLAGFISDRDVGRRTRLASGTVLEIDGTKVIADIGGVSYPCSSKLKVLAVGDAVSVSFSSGNHSRGQIVGKL